MFKHVTFFAALVILSMVSTAPKAQQSSPTTSKPLAQKIVVPGANYEFSPGSINFSPAGNPSTDTLLTALTFWISENFNVPANYNLPKISFIPVSKMVELRYKSLLSAQLVTANVPGKPGQRDVVSIYDDAKKTIYLREDWTGNTVSDFSILVHELVHHLQNLARLKFECPQEREQIAYNAQEQWLRLFGGSLSQDFEIDPFTLLLSTKCGL